jgi:hypothetical protein
VPLLPIPRGDDVGLHGVVGRIRREQMPKIATGKSSIKKLLVLIEAYLRAYGIDRLYLVSFDNLEWLKNVEGRKNHDAVRWRLPAGK